MVTLSDLNPSHSYFYVFDLLCIFGMAEALQVKFSTNLTLMLTSVRMIAFSEWGVSMVM